MPFDQTTWDWYKGNADPPQILPRASAAQIGVRTRNVAFPRTSVYLPDEQSKLL